MSLSLPIAIALHNYELLHPIKKPTTRETTNFKNTGKTVFLSRYSEDKHAFIRFLPSLGFRSQDNYGAHVKEL
jgi:hypothetical protein